MKNKKIIRGISLFILTVLLISTFALPVFATVDSEEEPPTFVEQFIDTLFYIVELVFTAFFVVFFSILFIGGAILLFFLGAIWLLFELGAAFIDLVMVIVNGIIGLF